MIIIIIIRIIIVIIFILIIISIIIIIIIISIIIIVMCIYIIRMWFIGRQYMGKYNQPIYGDGGWMRCTTNLKICVRLKNAAYHPKWTC